ncbi:Ferredoxin [Polaromonas sp. YR568]|uniref:2Fe-2S iron-sulfur cluster-binding protein n=1 Tax=Polaromonas sp. YR568 TaxID=1855301 RepID=UPI0008F1B449|nr:2Fe-2S iron-sulfur cluster-binding protein [Polaromonas sp. YR568]SFU40234.1 Ferredoxin [Polaromonas sp. YR568]
MNDPAQFSVRLAPEGTQFSASPSLPILQSALLAGVVMDSSCRNGTCRTCICRLASGEVAYRIEWPGLSAEEKREGYILPCVAYPLSDLVIQPAD